MNRQSIVILVFLVIAGICFGLPVYAVTMQEWIEKGDTNKSLHQYVEAIKAYDQALEIDPGYFLGWYNKSIVLRQIGQYDEAIAAYDQALSIHPEYEWAWTNKGDFLYSLGRYNEAIDACNRAIEIDPEFFDAWIIKGDSLYDLGRYDEAVIAYDRVLKNNPNDNWAKSKRDRSAFYHSLISNGKGADLIVSELNDVVFNSKSREIIFKPVVKNQGISSTRYQFRIAYFLSKEKTTKPFMEINASEYPIDVGDDILSLNQGNERESRGEKSVYISNEIPFGVYWFGVFVDSGDSNEEMDEENNVLYWENQIEIRNDSTLNLIEHPSVPSSPVSECEYQCYARSWEVDLEGNMKAGVVAGGESGCDSIRGITWDFGDGTSITAANNEEVIHSYLKPGTYTPYYSIMWGSGKTDSTSCRGTIRSVIVNNSSVDYSILTPTKSPSPTMTSTPIHTPTSTPKPDLKTTSYFYEVPTVKQTVVPTISPDGRETFIAQDKTGWSLSMDTNGPWHYAYCLNPNCDEDTKDPNFANGNEIIHLNVGSPQFLGIRAWVSGPGDGKSDYTLHLYYGSTLISQVTFPLKGMGLFGVLDPNYSTKSGYDTVTSRVNAVSQGACMMNGDELDCRPN